MPIIKGIVNKARTFGVKLYALPQRLYFTRQLITSTLRLGLPAAALLFFIGCSPDPARSMVVPKDKTNPANLFMLACPESEATPENLEIFASGLNQAAREHHEKAGVLGGFRPDQPLASYDTRAFSKLKGNVLVALPANACPKPKVEEKEAEPKEKDDLPKVTIPEGLAEKIEQLEKKVEEQGVKVPEKKPGKKGGTQPGKQPEKKPEKGGGFIP